MRTWVLACALLACGCRGSSAALTLVAPAELAPVLDLALEDLAVPGLERVSAAAPRSRLAEAGKLGLAVELEPGCAECYRFEGTPSRLVLVAGGTLGVQYGLAHYLEALGYRFNHPFASVQPRALPTSPAEELAGQSFSPEVARRGLHLHTLHPIEGLWDFWVPSPGHLDGARKTLNWLVRNRGNYLQWCALDDIMKSAAVADAWRAHTRSIIDLAQARGVKVGLALQLFGQSNLQNAFDLIDAPQAPDVRAEMTRRWRVLLDGLEVSTLNLSFGEFFGADPQAFVERVNDAWQTLQAVKPGAELTATIHLGNYPDLQVTYGGRTQLYYYLVRYADPAIVPWVHSVMYFNLFEDAGGAYLYDRFDEHRAYLLERLAAGQGVGYFPESAYWIAFDNAVPMHLPLYLRSRHLDLARLREAARARGGAELADHVLFSSGWEWGYWQTDAAVLRMGYALPEKWESLLDFFWPQAPGLAAQLAALGEEQHRALLVGRLAAYLAGRDQIIDTGEKLGIFSQPDRVQLDELAALDGGARADFERQVVAPLEAHAAATHGIEAQVQALGLDAADPFQAEAQDSVAVTAARARFVARLYRATLEFAATGAEGPSLAQAEAELQGADRAVSARRRKFFWHEPLKLLRDGPNPTFYQYGYLRDADSLCFWRRELAQARNLIRQAGETVPGCVL